ncbi:hypothetical protein HYH02_004882 [Chlamydomonas schloesseri]|uniref:NECAP PHear domain-containing protein n=1 Tax=Chlamydomonas schloesseri TaxID=2026947 RepID=A0A835WNB7_9CHLO|nr:hypothetical protein HYH02_004882 [Chlamydomonas schloesseri]|eukprot:KAG2450378.1 hypothetical protein HYH02_004882 [Chlamydomonas schloesseri]
MEDVNSGELFAMCPVPYGQRNVAVEPVTDSSRYYVLRVEDPITKRHAFLGMGFDNRSDAFDFNEALVRHEQQVARERAAKAKLAGGPGPAAGPAAGGGLAGSTAAAAAASSSAAAEVDVLYRHTADLKLQEGQTMRVNMSGIKKPGAAGATGGKGFLESAGLPAAGGLLVPPPPPPATSAPSHAAAASAGAPQAWNMSLAPPPHDALATPAHPQQPGHQQQSPQPPARTSGGIFTYSDSAAPPPDITPGATPAGSSWAAAAPPAAAAPAAQEGWATFD